MTRVYTPTKEVHRRTRATNDLVTPEILAAMIGYVGRGNSFETASSRAGISRPTFYGWLRRGRDVLHWMEANEGPVKLRDQLLADFVVGMDQAEAEAEGNALDRIIEDDAWQSDAWYLERRYPDRYGRRQRIDMGNADGQPFRMAQTPMFDPSLLTDDELETVVRLLRKAQPGGDVIEMVPRRELTA